FNTSRGAPPSMETRAKVPSRSHPTVNCGLRSMAISPVLETDNSAEFCKPRERETGLCMRVTKISSGSPIQVAEYTMVCPSGAKRAAEMKPRRKVSRGYPVSGSDFKTLVLEVTLFLPAEDRPGRGGRNKRNGRPRNRGEPEGLVVAACI